MRRLTATLITLVTALVVPASAIAAPAPDFKVVAGPIVVAPRTEGQYASLAGAFRQRHSQPIKLVYTIDLSDVSGFVRLTDLFVLQQDSADTPCETSGDVITCTQPQVQVLGGTFVPMVSFQVVPTVKAKPGDEGAIHIEATVDDGSAVKTDAMVTVGEPVNLAAVGRVRMKALPGAPATARPQVRNTGKRAINGAVLLLSISASMLTSKFTNCSEGDLIICTFDQKLDPGRTYQVAQPMTFRSPKDAAAGSTTVNAGRWITLSTFDSWNGYFVITSAKAKKGPVLRLEPVPGAASVPQLDVHPEDDLADLTFQVTGKRGARLVPVGARPAAAVGDPVRFKVGYRNAGPATLYPALFASDLGFAHVQMPGNLRVTHADARCLNDLTGTSYLCVTTDKPIRAGEGAMYAFTATVTKGKAGGGEVGFGTETAKILVGPGLPATGPSVLAGLLLVLAGGLVRWFSRRGRTPGIS